MKKQKLTDQNDPRFRTWLMTFLRRASYMWGPRTEALKAARVSWGKYLCNHCNEIFQKKDIDIDHIEPVIDVAGFDSWDAVIDRLFCQAEGYQILCKPCHKIKTREEKDQRVANRRVLK